MACMGISLPINEYIRDVTNACGELFCATLDRRQAADTAMESAAYRFAQAQREQGAIVLASNDQGFAQVLRYCGSLGCYTVALGAPRA